MLSTNLPWVNCWDSSWVATGPPPGHFLSLHLLPYLTHESLPSSGVLPGPPPAPLTVLLLPRGCTFSFCEHLFAIISQDSVSFWTPRLSEVQLILNTESPTSSSNLLSLFWMHLIATNSALGLLLVSLFLPLSFLLCNYVPATRYVTTSETFIFSFFLHN